MKHIDVPDVDDKAVFDAAPTQEQARAFDAAIADIVRPIGKWDMPKDRGTKKDGSIVPWTSWDTTKWIKDHMSELKARAAQIAIDMETGVWPGWEKGRPYVKEEIARAMGFRDGAISFMEEPAFSAALHWERNKRDLNYSASIADTRAIVKSTYTAGWIKLCHRMLTDDPTPMKVSEIVDILKLAARELQLETPQKTQDVRQYIAVFLNDIERLPKKSQERAIGIYQNSIKELLRIADRAQGALGSGQPGGEAA